MLPKVLLLLIGALGSAPSGAGSEFNWTGFRGEGDSTVDAGAPLPVEWSHDRNVAWKVDLPGTGQSTPVVFGGRIFLTSVEGPRKEKLNLFSLEMESGKIVWQRQMASSRPHPAGDRVSRAAPTPAVEAGRVYVLFDSGDLFAFTHTGRQQWHVNMNERFGPIQPGHDFGSSVRLAGERLFVHVSQAEPSYLVSLRKHDGSTAWRNHMPREGGYATPVVVRHGDRELLLASSQGGLIAFDPASGEQVWKQVRDGARGGGIPSVTVAQGMAVVASAERGKTFAVRLADPAQPAWHAEGASTQYSSPLVHQGRVYMVNSVGVLFVLDLLSGKQLSAQRLPGPTWASAIAAGDGLYFFTTEGTTVVMRTGDTPLRISENTLPVAGTVYAAAPAARALLLRTGAELWKVAVVGRVTSYANPETFTGPARAEATGPAPKPPPEGRPGQQWKNPRDGQLYVLVVGGTFQMGCAREQCQPDEAAQREATIEKPFWLGRTEVPVAAYRAFASQTGARMPEEPMLLDRPLNPRWREAQLPVLNMTASRAEAYCAWAGGRLPNEAEWEYAARGGAGSAPAAAAQVWSAENSGIEPLTGKFLQLRRGIEEKLYENRNAPHPVGMREPNGFGLLDMLGNAGEWTLGLFEDHPPVVRGGPPSPPGTPFRVSRGGSFATPVERTRATSRQRHTLDGRMESVGFRCLLPAPAP
jgi:formylglycine-generating enzyme required for sulfatase activity